MPKEISYFFDNSRWRKIGNKINLGFVNVNTFAQYIVLP